MVDVVGFAAGILGDKAIDNLARKGYSEQQQGMIGAIQPNYSPSKEEQIGDLMARGVFNRVAPGMGSAMTSMNELNRMHQDAIGVMADKGMPGFIEQEIEINGQTVTIYVDASATASGGNSKVYADYDTSNLDKDERAEFEREVRRQKKHYQAQAEEDVYNETVEHGEQGYNDRLDSYITNGLGRDYAAQQSQASLAPQPQQPMPNQSLPTATV